MEEDINKNKDIYISRCGALSLLRWWCVLWVFYFHCTLHLQSNFGPLQGAMSQGGIAMTGFFMLSGFLAYYNAAKNEPQQFDTIHYLKKRIASLFPLYLIITLLFLILFPINHNRQIAILLPIELLMMQSYFPDITRYLHNSGTWFFTSMATGYFLVPYFFSLIYPLTKKKLILVGFIVYAICAYSPYVMIHSGAFGTYTNPFFRVLEMFFGMLLAAYAYKLTNNKYAHAGLGLVAIFVLLIISISILNKYPFFHDNYMGYNVLIVPLYALILLLSFTWKTKGFLAFFLNSSLAKYIDSLSLAFFMAQLFTFFIMQKAFLNRTFSNIAIIIIALVINTLIAIFLHSCCENPLKKLFKRLLHC